MRYSIAVGASLALVALIAATLYFAPPPPEKIDKTKVPDQIPFILAGSGGTDENATEIIDGPAISLHASSIPPWNINVAMDVTVERGLFLEPAQHVQRSVSEWQAHEWPVSLVLGVTWNGESRAYAADLFTPESASLINDRIGGDPVVVSLCPHSGSAVAALRQQNGIELTFLDTGKQWRGNAVWQDQETESLWSQILARSLAGQLADTSLTTIPVTVTSWDKWRQSHPDTTLVMAERDSTESAPRDWLAVDSEYGIGIRVLDQDVFYTLADFVRAPLRRDEVKQTPLVATYFPDSGIVHVFRRLRAIQEFEINLQGQFVDKIAATNWDLATGKAVSGREAGQQLERVRYQWCSRAGWATFFQTEPPAER